MNMAKSPRSAPGVDKDATDNQQIMRLEIFYKKDQSKFKRVRFIDFTQVNKLVDGCLSQS
jgi:hypothetical protein